MIFDSPPKYVDLMPESNAAQIEEETMLFRASASFSREHGGPITQRFLDVLARQGALLGVSGELVIDSRSHMLMRGQYPCIPGWHHDDVARGGKRDQPLYAKRHKKTQHLIAVVDASDQPTWSLPEFAHRAIEVPWPLPEEATVYAVWDAHISATFPGCGTTMRNRQVLAFDCDSFHRGKPAHRTGWRFFIRASWFSDLRPENKIRRNANVYMPWSTAGW